MAEGADSAGKDTAQVLARSDAVAEALRDHLKQGLAAQMEKFRKQRNEFQPSDNPHRDSLMRDAFNQLRKRGDALTQSLLSQIHNKFDPDAERRAMESTITVSLDDLSLQKPESLDESIAVTNVGNRGELLYEHQLWEIRRRLEWWRDETSPRVSDKALAPYAVCQAFFDAMRQIDFDRELRLPLFWQFDRYVLRQLHDVYEGMIEIFDQFGFTPLQPVTRQRTAAAKPAPHEPARPTETVSDPTSDTGTSAPATAWNQSSPSNDSPAHQQSLDPQTWQMLSQLAQTHHSAAGAARGAGTPATGALQGDTQFAASGPTSTQAPRSGHSGGTSGGLELPPAYSDVQLAQDITSLLNGQTVQGWEGAQTTEMSSRAAVVGRAFNQIVADPNFSRPIKSHFEGLRFSVLKTALADADFFRDQQHPMRILLAELARLAATSRLYAPDEVSRLGHMLDSLQQQFAVDAAEVRSKQHDQEQLSPDELERFLDDLLADQKARRQALIEKSQRVVSEELWLQLASRSCPDKLRETLHASWEPMMALRLLRHGVSSKSWNQGIDLLKRIVDFADPPDGRSFAQAERNALIDDFSRNLESVGMLRERVDNLREALDESLDRSTQISRSKAQQGSDSMTTSGIPLPSNRAEALEAALLQGAWFEVFDRDRDTVRWLQAQGTKDDKDQVLFSEFRRQEQFSMLASEFIDDLRSGLSAAVNPTPRARAALQWLMQSED